tara:strand:+ start:60391 stop:60699 length:309 start_codon:yes stop_codon:yes gene_type:complete
MLHATRHPLVLAFCTVFVLDIVLVFGGPSRVDSPDENPDWLFSEFELEESEDFGEEETLIQDVEFSIEISLSNSMIHDVEFSVQKSDRYESHISRGPPVTCC